MVGMIESLFGFEALRAQDEVRAFYGHSYEAIKHHEAEQRTFEKIKRETENSRIDEFAHQINKS